MNMNRIRIAGTWGMVKMLLGCFGCLALLKPVSCR